MENDLELEDRILTMLSTQYEGIYQIDIDNDSVLCIYNRGNKFKKDGNVELEQWVQRMVDRCHYEDRGGLSFHRCLKTHKHSIICHSVERTVHC